MHSYYRERKTVIAHFKAEARKAFAGICASYGLQERKPRLSEGENQFQVVFSNRKIHLCVEGIHWGKNATLSLAVNRKRAPRYDIYEMMLERQPPSPLSGTQTEQLYLFSRYLQEQAPDILSGDDRFFEVLAARATEREKEREAVRQAELKTKLDAGYIKITNSFGYDILRKPRGVMPEYQAVKKEFPQAIEVLLNDYSELLAAPMPSGKVSSSSAVITVCCKEVGEWVEQGEALCSIGVDKAEMEISAGVSGKLLWHLPEGSIVQAVSIVALVLPEKKPKRAPRKG